MVDALTQARQAFSQITSNVGNEVGNFFNAPRGPNNISITQAAQQTAPHVAQDFGNTLRQGLPQLPSGNRFADSINAVTGSVNKAIQPVWNAVANTGQAIGQSVLNYGAGVNKIANNPSPLDKVSGAAQAAYGVGGVVAAGTPLFQGANIAASLPQFAQANLPARVGSGIMQGMTGVQGLAPNVPSQNTNLPLFGQTDLAKAAGGMVGFTQNPVNKLIFGATEGLNIGLKNPITNFVLSNGLKGGVENTLMTLGEMPTTASLSQKAQYLLKNFGLGAAMNIGVQGASKGVGAVANKIGESEAGQFTTEQLGKAYDELQNFTRKWNTPVKTMEMNEQIGQFTTRPMWQQKIMDGWNAYQAQSPQEKQRGGINFGADIGLPSQPNTESAAQPPSENPASGNDFLQSLGNPTDSSAAPVPPLNAGGEPAPETPPGKTPQEVAPTPPTGEQAAIPQSIPPKEDTLQTQSVPVSNPSQPGSIPQEKNPFETPEGDLKKPLKVSDIKQSLVERDAADQGIQVRANLLSSQIDRVVKSPAQVAAFRDTIEHPENLQMNAQKAGISIDTFTDLTKKFSDFTDYLHTQQTSSGSDLQKIENYYPHIFDTSTDAYQKAVEERGKTQDYSGWFNRSRIFEDLNQAKNAGVEPQNAKVGQDIQDLSQANSKELTARVFSDHLQQQFPEDVSKVPVQGFLQSRIPGMQGTYLSPRMIKATELLEPADFGTVGKVIDQINTIAKGLKLAGGGMHYLNMARGYTAGAIGEGKLPDLIGSVRAGVSQGFFNDAMQRAVDSGTVDKAGKMGVDFNASEFKPEGFTGKIKQAIDNNPLTAPLFKRIIPYMQMKLVEGAPEFDTTTPKGKADAVAYGKQVNNAVGVINNAIGDSIIKNKLAKFGARLGALAPMYQESRLGQLATAANPTQWNPATNYARLQLLIGTAITAGIAEGGRKIMTGQFSSNIKDFVRDAIISPNIPTGTEKPADKYNGPIKQTAMLPTGPMSEIAGAVQDPGHFAVSHLGALLSDAYQFASNQDYYGNPLSKTNDSLQKAGKLAVNQLPVPAVQALKTQGIGTQIPQGVRDTLGINANQPWQQSAANTAGLRITSDPNDPNYQKQQTFFQNYDLAKKNNLNYAQGQQLQNLSTSEPGVNPQSFVKSLTNQQAQQKTQRAAGTDLYTQKDNAVKAALSGDYSEAQKLGLTNQGMRLHIRAQMLSAADALVAGDTQTAQKLEQTYHSTPDAKLMSRAARDRGVTLLQQAGSYHKQGDTQSEQAAYAAFDAMRKQYPFQFTPQDKLKIQGTP